jgi:CheY-like chemotaxis protein
MMNILVADDAPSVRKLLRLILEPVHTVIEAEDGDDALRQLAAHRPDVAILDVSMPARTGLEVCRLLRSDPDPDLAATAVIVITANGVQTDRSMALAAGADHFLTKPFSPVSIVQVVEQVSAVRRRLTH